MPIEVFEPKVKSIDDGFYAEAKVKGVSAPAYLATLDPPPQEHVDAAVGMFRQKHDNKLKPANDAAVLEWATNRASLANMLSWHESLSGNKVITVHDFYNSDTAITSLFPAWLESEIQAGLLSTGLVPWLTMGEVPVDSTKVTTLYDSTGSTERSLRKIGEGAELPSVTLTLADSIIYLYKYGRRVESSYESLAMQRLDALGAHFRKITQQVAIDETDAALDILIAGDGTTAGAAETNATDRDVATAGTIVYSDLVNWCLDFSIPYNCDKAVLGDTDLAQLWNMAEFKDRDYTATPNLPLAGPKQVNYARWQGSVTGSHYLSRMVVGIDSRYALQKYTYGAMINETDQIIRRQMREVTFSYYVGFRKWDSAATVVLDANAVL